MQLQASTNTDGTKYYEKKLCYVDNVLVISQKAMQKLEGTKRTLRLKGNKADKPVMHLGVSLEQVKTDDGRICWVSLPGNYIKMR